MRRRPTWLRKLSAVGNTYPPAGRSAAATFTDALVAPSLIEGALLLDFRELVP
jgi:hypothetical protein